MSFAKFAQEKDAASFRDAFLEKIQAAVADEIEQQKIAVAQSMFGAEEQQVEEEMTDEELDEILDSMSEEELEALAEEIEHIDEDALKARQEWMKAKTTSTGNPKADRARKVKSLMKTFPLKKEEAEQMDEVSPPGREKQVKALKKTGVRNPWAVAWASYNKSKKK